MNGNRRARALAYALSALVSASCGNDLRARSERITGGDVARGKLAFRKLGCGACHDASPPGAIVGPSLRGLAQRSTLPGGHPHTPDVLRSWLRFPGQLLPGTAMPELGLTEGQARDLSAYLYTLE